MLPAGNTPFLVGHATGTQGYVCLPTITGAVNATRPEATSFHDPVGPKRPIITHFLSHDTEPNKVAPDPLPFGSATWQSSVYSSKVWAAPADGCLVSVDVGNKRSFPDSADYFFQRGQVGSSIRLEDNASVCIRQAWSAGEMSRRCSSHASNDCERRKKYLVNCSDVPNLHGALERAGDAVSFLDTGWSSRTSL